MAHHVALHAQVIGQAHVARTADLLQHHVQHEGERLRSVAAVAHAQSVSADSRARTISPTVGSEKYWSISALSACAASAGSYKFEATSREWLSICKVLAAQGIHTAACWSEGRQPSANWFCDGIACANGVARQGQPLAHAARAAAQEVATTHIGNRPMAVSGMAILVRSVTTRRAAPWLIPMPPPITMPSMKAM